MTLLLLGCVLSLTAIYFRVKPKFRHVGPFLPDSLLIGLSIYAIGAVWVVHAEQLPNAERILLMSGTALIGALAGAIFFSLLCARSYRGITFTDHFAAAAPGPKERLLIYGLLVLSALVCIAFVVVVLSNSIVGALLSVASLVTDSTLLEARKAITSGSEGYFAPGYIKQFRDIIIPILVIAVMAIQPVRRYNLVSLGALGAAGLAMVLSGQRLVFVVLFLTLMLGAFYVQANREAAGQVKRRSARATTLVAFAILALMYLQPVDSSAHIGRLHVDPDGIERGQHGPGPVDVIRSPAPVPGSVCFLFALDEAEAAGYRLVALRISKLGKK